jgi:ribosomal protein S18 acetylase RimI-like enzyme
VTASPQAVAAFVVRELVEADLAAYKALRDEALARDEDAFTSDAATEALRSAESYRSRLGIVHDAIARGFTLGAFDGGLLVGALTIERDSRRKVRHVGHLVGMMVAGARQRSGIGRALLDAAITRARDDGELHLITLSVTASNPAAVGLYERAGFVRYGRLPRAIRVDDRFLDKDLMVLALR